MTKDQLNTIYYIKKKKYKLAIKIVLEKKIVLENKYLTKRKSGGKKGGMTSIQLKIYTHTYYLLNSQIHTFHILMFLNYDITYN